MTEKLLDVSAKIDSATIALFQDFVPIAGEIPWFVIGATARDLFLHLEHKLEIRRATVDTDLGVQLESWEQFTNLKSLLLQSEKFTPGEAEHRVYHRGVYPLDLVPFGGLAKTEEQIVWPTKTEMNISGYADSFRASVLVRISTNPELKIRYATIPGITILKIFAWADERQLRTKDAQDLAYIFYSYLDLGNWDRLIEQDQDLTNKDDFTTTTAGSRLLGRDVAKIANSETIQALYRIIDKELRAEGPLVMGIARELTAYTEVDALALLQSFRLGLQDEVNS